MKALVAAFNQEKALVGAFSVITNLRMELFGALVPAAALLQGEGAAVLGVEAAADRARVRVEADHGLVPSSSLEVVLLITMAGAE